MAAGGRKSEYGRNWSVLEFPGPGRAASAARKVRAPLARPRALGTLRSPGTAAPGIARMWSLRRWLSTSRWGLRTGNGFKITKEKRTVRGSFQGLGEVCSPSSARGVAQSPPPSGSWKPGPLRDALSDLSGPACVSRHENRIAHLCGGPVCLSGVSSALRGQDDGDPPVPDADGLRMWKSRLAKPSGSSPVSQHGVWLLVDAHFYSDSSVWPGFPGGVHASVERTVFLLYKLRVFPKRCAIESRDRRGVPECRRRFRCLASSSSAIDLSFLIMSSVFQRFNLLG